MSMDRLIALQRLVESRATPDEDVLSVDRLCVTRFGQLAHINFYGDPFGESFRELLEVLTDEPVAKCVASLVLCGPDEGSNGTRNWDLTTLAQSRAFYPNLRCLSIEQTKPGDHNISIVAHSYDEDGVIASLLSKAPALEVLITPSAPSPDFFRIGSETLTRLSVDAGYDHQRFISNLARSLSFPKLWSLEFGEYRETYMDDFSSLVTPFADYRELFSSRAFESVKVFRWRSPSCSSEEMSEVKALTKDCQVQVVRWSAEWIG